MIDLKLILKDKNKIREELETRQIKVAKEIKDLNKLGLMKNKTILELEKLQKDLNKSSKKLGFLDKTNDEFKRVRKNNKKIKSVIAKNSKKLTKNKEKISNILFNIPNIPNKNAPLGETENDNIIGKENLIGKGKIKSDISHNEIAEKLDLIDFKRAAKISGSRFAIYKNDAAKIIRGLGDLFLNEALKKGYEELIAPVIVKTACMYGTGQLPKFSNDLYSLNQKNKWLIPTGEVSLTNYYANEIVDLSTSKKLVTHSLCFRLESGSGGKDTKGAIRLHEFRKVELVKITKQQNKETEFKELVNDVRDLVKLMKIPYREVILCRGDLGFSSEYTIDFEIWFPSQNKFREISSVSMFSDFQARRSKIRYKENGKSILATTMNGSGLAIDRLLAAIIENNYNKKTNKVEWPEVLQKYLK